MPRPLTPDDAPRYVALRQRMLIDTPFSFLGMPGDDDALKIEVMRERIAGPGNAVIGVDGDAHLPAPSPWGEGGPDLSGPGEGSLQTNPTCKQVGPPDAGRGEPPLIAVAGVYRSPRIKTQHKANIWGVYVAPEARGRGLGRAVVQGAIDLARTWPGVHVVCLSCSERAAAALALYRSMGFVQWGLEPDAVRIDDESAAEVHMQLRS